MFYIDLRYKGATAFFKDTAIIISKTAKWQKLNLKKYYYNYL